MAPSPDTSKTTKLERYNTYIRKVNTTKILSASSKLLFRLTLLVALILIFFFTFNNQPVSDPTISNHRVLTTSHFLSSAFYGSGASWEKEVRRSSTPRRLNGFSVLVTGAGGFVGTHCSLALKKRGDGVLGLDNFNSYYDPSLKRARQTLLKQHEIFIVEGDLNDGELLSKLFDIVPFTHVLHLAAQAGVRYAMQNPQSYVRSNIAGFVNLLETAKNADPQPSIVWASSSSVYGLNTENPFSESHRTDQPASLYAATKKAGEEIAHTYNHIYGLAITGLRFFTVYGPWGRPDMAYFFFTKDILNGKPINVYQTHDEKEVARDFTYNDDDVVSKGALRLHGVSFDGNGNQLSRQLKICVYTYKYYKDTKGEKCRVKKFRGVIVIICCWM
ncbi:putative UDP-glucuronate 4-epimerase [Helianthus annuus]|nr:putative UDP-glucuronate 4-epimerase [Helianthus annuus]KAJ0620217.1 putative UDP-glucuronate 4-epimerase [Helianthus annuus]KAJ0778669.1 putative UDP-glucuronate 4-epimerase [Helianthus annuus]KAJ0787623.1 putative UDP-glucuronate 4-epimerase [Helianthus annuus]